MKDLSEVQKPKDAKPRDAHFETLTLKKQACYV